MNLIILKADISHVGLCKESFLLRNACGHKRIVEFVFLALGEIASAAKLKFYGNDA